MERVRLHLPEQVQNGPLFVMVSSAVFSTPLRPEWTEIDGYVVHQLILPEYWKQDAAARSEYARYLAKNFAGFKWHVCYHKDDAVLEAAVVHFVRCLEVHGIYATIALARKAKAGPIVTWMKEHYLRFLRVTTLVSLQRKRKRALKWRQLWNAWPLRWASAAMSHLL